MLSPLTEEDTTYRQSIFENLRRAKILERARMQLSIKTRDLDKLREDIMFTMEVGFIRWSPTANKEASTSSAGHYYFIPLHKLLVSAATWLCIPLPKTGFTEPSDSVANRYLDATIDALAAVRGGTENPCVHQLRDTRTLRTFLASKMHYGKK
jgi:hypothetical protein